MSSSTAGRYDIREPIGSGGMATVHLARSRGSAGFARAVAIKRLLPAYGADPAFSAMLLDEARLASRVRHPNVVPVLDVVAEDRELFVVMEYVHGDALASLIAAEGRALAPEVAASIMIGVLHGLHAAHIATGTDGRSLGIVHRDVSPQNVIVGVDGLARVLDFGVAKAAARLQTTAEGQVKGKIAYMAREQLEGGDIDARADVFAAGAVFWELLTGQRLFTGTHTGEIVARVLQGRVEAPSTRNGLVSKELDDVVLRALATDRAQRFPSAQAMAEAIEHAVRPAPARAVGEWVARVAGAKLDARAEVVGRLERGDSVRPPDPARANADANAIDGTVAAKTPPVTTASASFARENGASVAEPTTSAGSTSRAHAMLALAIGVVMGAVVIWTLRSRTAPTSASAEPVVVAPAPTLSAASPMPSVAPAPTAPSPVVAPSANPDPVTSAAPTASATRRTRPSTAHPSSRRESCNPPYYIGADGLHVPKPQCLE